MNGMADDSFALSVVEATMQEWMTAVAQASLGLPPLPAKLRTAPVVFAPHPAPMRTVIRGASRRPVPVTAPVEATSVAGARAIYWLGLAAVLARAVLL